VVGNPAGSAHAVQNTSLSHRFNIGPRLTICFVLIILAMMIGNGVLLWQFGLARAEIEHLRGVDQELIAVLRAHISLISLHQRLDALADAENTAVLVAEADGLRRALHDASQRTQNSLNTLPATVSADPALVGSLAAIHDGLPAQLDAIVVLAQAADWQAVRLRLAYRLRPLQAASSSLVENIDREVSDARARAISNIGRVESRIRLIVSATAGLSLLFAGFLGLVVTRSVTLPLGRLMDAAKALGRGEFDHRVSIVGRDELAHLGQVFNDTAGTVRDLYETLSTREAYLAEAQRLSRTGSFGWNTQTGELVWSDETFRIFEYPPAVTPSVELVLKRTHPEDVALVQGLVDRVSHGGSEWDLEHRLLMPDGSVKYIRAVAHVVADPAGARRFVGAVTDLTASKRAEEALRQSQATLAHVTRMTTSGEITAAIAHEVNQPLSAAITNSSTCLMWLEREPADVQEARDAASRCLDDVTRAADIISRIRRLFNKGTPQRTPVAVRDIVDEMIGLLRNEAERHSISIRSDLAVDCPVAIADRVQLQQVFMNLMANAIDAMKGNASPCELVIRSKQTDDGQLQIEVSDSGPGVGEQQTNQIFNAFFTTKPEGTGMGLSISRSIIESHGGRLWVTANSGRGATFHFTLPVVEGVT